MPVPFALERVLGWTGYRVDDVQGRGVGRLEAVLVDREEGAPQWLLVALLHPTGQYTALPIVRDMLAGAGHLLTPWPKEQILSAPRAPESGALTVRVEREACTAFGVPATRGATLSRWERRATSSRLIDARNWSPGPRGQDADRRGPGRDGRDAAEVADTAARPVPAALLEAERRAEAHRRQTSERRADEHSLAAAAAASLDVFSLPVDDVFEPPVDVFAPSRGEVFVASPVDVFVAAHREAAEREVLPDALPSAAWPEAPAAELPEPAPAEARAPDAPAGIPVGQAAALRAAVRRPIAPGLKQR